ncbi:ABC transporter permease [Microbacterium mangrovi]|uniref:ABC transporter permease n=1 Tax=Microbacterium mangrovi TaxID=1348253 RepID=A0A0B1ZZR4_9MICO|nr:ABC transporter permease [Microbacterium mangrovi]
MGRLLTTRIVQIPVILLVVSVLTFWLIQVVPGDPGRNALGQYATAEQVAAWDAANGLTGPVIERYLHWLGGFVTGDWGSSFLFHVPARGFILARLANSFLLGLLAFVIMVPLAILLGALQAYREGRRSDRAITIGLMSVSAMPEFVIGVLLLVVFAVAIPVVPVQASGAVGDGIGATLSVMVLPAITLAIASLAVLTRMVRTGTLATIDSAYHRTAVLKGLGSWRTLRRHVVRNALVPTIPLLGIYLGGLLGGSAIVETLFNYPGLGAAIVSAAERKDVVLLTDAIIVTGAVSLLALLLADVLLILIDPRIRFERGADR